MAFAAGDGMSVILALAALTAPSISVIARPPPFPPSFQGPWTDRRKRLKFRAWRRGFREIDLILGGFADRYLVELDETGLQAFERLLDAPDQDVYAWITEEAPAPPNTTRQPSR